LVNCLRLGRTTTGGSTAAKIGFFRNNILFYLWTCGTTSIMLQQSDASCTKKFAGREWVPRDRGTHSSYARAASTPGNACCDNKQAVFGGSSVVLVLVVLEIY
jgi:hypothetical protein